MEFDNYDVHKTNTTKLYQSINLKSITPHRIYYRGVLQW